MGTLALLGTGRGSPGVTFDPLALAPDLMLGRNWPTGLWQDVAGTSAAATASDPVHRADDESGHGLHLTWPHSGQVPALSLSGGLRALQYDGSNDCLVNATGLAGGSIGDFTLVIAARELTRVQGTLYDLSGWGNSTDRLRAHAPFNDGTYYFDVEDASVGRVTGAWSIAANTQNVVLTHRRSGGAIDVRRNGVSLGTATQAGAVASQRIWLGAGANFSTPANPSLFYSGLVFGLFVKCAYIADVADLETYFGAKAGLVL